MDLEHICELSKDKNHLFVLYGCPSGGDIENLIKAANHAGVQGVIVQLSDETELKDMPHDEAAQAVKTMVGTFTDEQLLAIGLQRVGDLAVLIAPVMSAEQISNFRKDWNDIMNRSPSTNLGFIQS